MEELSAKLNKMADLDDELKQVKTKHEMTAKQNADMFIKLQVQHITEHHGALFIMIATQSSLTAPATACKGDIACCVWKCGAKRCASVRLC